MNPSNIAINRELLDQRNEDKLIFKTEPGLTEEVVKKISADKNEPEWMLKKRLEALKLFHSMPMPKWGPSLRKLDLNKIIFYQVPDAKKNAKSWEDVPEDIKNTFEKLGIPEAERKALSGVGAQYESQGVYHNLKKEWEKKGVIFEDCDIALKKYEDLFKKYFMTKCVSPHLHRFAALHAAVWSGGTFIYIPPGVKVDIPMQAYFRMNAKQGGQFEHTLIIVDKDAEVQYIEGCSAPRHTENSLHVGCVEIFVKKGGKARYSSIENWSKNTYNLNTKRAVVEEEGIIEWVNGNMGSAVTMLYPASVLQGTRAKSNYLGVAFAGKNQNQDTGTKVFHLAPETSSTVISKSICKEGGITSYRGLLHANKNAKDSRSKVQCDALIIDSKSASNTFPKINACGKKINIAHEATVGKISQDKIFYLMSRGLSEEQATQMVVSGFIEPIVKALPLEYAVEMNRLIELEIEGSVG